MLLNPGKVLNQNPQNSAVPLTPNPQRPPGTYTTLGILYYSYSIMGPETLL